MRGGEEVLVQIGAGIRRLLAPNPSLMTGTGTNTYLIETDAGVVVIDPGPDLEAHFKAVVHAMGPRPLAGVLVSHAHLDHSALAQRLARHFGTQTMGFGSAEAGMRPLMLQLSASTRNRRTEGVDHKFVPDRILRDGERLLIGGLAIDVLHCPGHMSGHLCFALGQILFTGDHIMGWSTSLISPPDGDMTDYMASLGRIANGAWSQFLPGHGDPVTDPNTRVRDLIAHRMARDAAILAEVRVMPSTPAMLAYKIYPEIAPQMRPAAERNILAHLLDLQVRNLVTFEHDLRFDSLFRQT